MIYPVRYDLLTDFEPVALLATTPYLFLAKNAVPADDLKGFIATRADKVSVDFSGCSPADGTLAARSLP